MSDPGPSSAGDERRFSDREFGLIMRKAFELEARTPRAVPGRDGMTLAEMRSIAVEVGLDPAAISSAAALLPAERTGTAARILGAPEAWKYEVWLDGPAGEPHVETYLQTVRRVLDQRGDVRRAGRVVEWKSVGRSDHIRVVLTPRDDGTVVDITGDRRPALLFAVLTPFVAWAAVAAVAGIAGSFAGGAFVLPAAATAAAFLTARIAWRSASARLRSRLERLALELRTDALRLGPGPAGGDSR